MFELSSVVDASRFLRKLVGLSAPVAQLDRASDYGSEGLRFESPRARFSHPTQQALVATRNKKRYARLAWRSNESFLAHRNGWPITRITFSATRSPPTRSRESRLRKS